MNGPARKRPPMTTAVLKPTLADLNSERDRLLDSLPFSEDELRERGSDFLLTPLEARILRRLDEIAFLLGDD